MRLRRPSVRRLFLIVSVAVAVAVDDAGAVMFWPSLSATLAGGACCRALRLSGQLLLMNDDVKMPSYNSRAAAALIDVSQPVE